MRDTIIDTDIRLVTEECCNCGVLFAMPKTLRNQFQSSGKWFYCPSGHAQRYTETEEMRLLKKLSDEQQKLANAQFELLAAEKKVKRLEKRIKNGACPCCHRQFVNLQKHMAGQHPDFAKE